MSCRRSRDATLLRLGGWVHLGRAVTGLAACSSAFVALWQQDAGWLTVAGLCALAWTVFALLHAFETVRLRCQHCTGALFASGSRPRPAGVRHLLGSPAMRTATQAAFRSHYRCQHCDVESSCHEHSEGLPALPTGAPGTRRDVVLQVRVPSRRR